MKYVSAGTPPCAPVADCTPYLHIAQFCDVLIHNFFYDWIIPFLTNTLIGLFLIEQVIYSTLVHAECTNSTVALVQ